MTCGKAVVWMPYLGVPGFGWMLQHLKAFGCLCGKGNTERTLMFFSGARCPAGCTLQAGGDWFCDSVIIDKISTDELSQTSSWMKDQSFLLWAQYYFYFPPSRE